MCELLMLLLSCAVLVDDMVRNRDNETFLLPEELFGKNDISKDIFGCVYVFVEYWVWLSVVLLGL